MGSLQNAFGSQTMIMEVGDKITLRGIIERMCRESEGNEFRKLVFDEDFGSIDPNIVILVNGVESSSIGGLDSEVEAGASIVLLPIAHGGCRGRVRSSSEEYDIG